MKQILDSEMIYEIVERLRAGGYDPRYTGSEGWSSRCPVHCGREHTLTIGRSRNNNFFLHCRGNDLSGHACTEADIIRSVGLRWDNGRLWNVGAD